MSTARQNQYAKLATKNRGMACIIGLLFPPIGYALVGKWGYALLCFITLGYLFTGFVVVPIHLWIMIGRARRKLNSLEQQEADAANAA